MWSTETAPVRAPAAAAGAVSVVLPVYNEAESLPELHRRLHAALEGLDYEIVYVDDGSTDGSAEVLERLAAATPERTRVVELRRNFGQTGAIAAGIDHASGDSIVLMDADLQNDPADIPMMLEKLAEGYDVVSGWRVDRKDAWLSRRLPSQLANGLISWTTGVALHDYGCTLKAYRRDVLAGFRLYGEMHRFIPAYAAQIGARIVEVGVRHHPRRFGTSKYGIGRTLKVLLDLITVKFFGTYSNRPIHLFGAVGFGLVALSVLILAGLVVAKLVADRSLIESPLLLMSVMLFILGFQSIFMGLMTELIVRTYHESQQKPTYAVRRVLGGGRAVDGAGGEDR